MTPPTPDDWTRLAIECAAALANTTLGMPFEVESLAAPEPVPQEGIGAYVAIVGEVVRVEIGIAANYDTCQLLAQALFGDDTPLPEPDVVDAMGELANIIAGGVQGGMTPLFPGLTLGLPLVVQGRVQATEHQVIARVAIRLGTERAWLLVLRSRGS